MDQCLTHILTTELSRSRKIKREKERLGEGYLNGGLVEVAEVGGGLAGLLAEHHGLGVDQAEGINDHFSFHTLDRIYHHCHCPLVQCFKVLQEERGKEI